MAFAKLQDRDGIVYIIADGCGHYKVGATNCQGLERRLIELQCGNAFRLRVVHQRLCPIDLTIHIETMSHQLLAASRVRGEWFRGKASLIIDAVNECADRAMSMDDAMDDLARISEEMKAERKLSATRRTELEEVMQDDKGVLRWRGRTGITLPKVY